jgi:hypothetical protein
MRNPHFGRIVDSGYWQRNGYKSSLFTLSENDRFAVLIFPLLIFIKKIADSRVKDRRGGFRLPVATGVSFVTPPQSGLP